MQTYDPIIDSKVLRRMRLAPLKAPRLGIALVLVPPSGELLTVPPGSSVPAARLGNYHTAYWIDVSDRELTIAEQLPSADPAFVFQAVLTCRCRVVDERAVARRQLHDVAGLVKTAYLPPMRAASGRHDIARTTEAEEAIALAVRDVRPDPALEVTGVYVTLPVHKDEVTMSARGYRDAVRSERVLGVHTEPLRELIATGQPGLLARHLAGNPDDTAAALEMLIGGDLAEGEQMLEAINIMYGTGTKDDEGLETWHVRKKLMDRFVTKALSGGALSASGRRTAAELGAGDGRAGGRIRGSLAGPTERDHWPGSPSSAGSGPDELTVIEGTFVEDDDPGGTGAERPASPGRARDADEAAARGSDGRSRRSRIVHSNPSPGGRERRKAPADPDRDEGR